MSNLYNFEIALGNSTWSYYTLDDYDAETNEDSHLGPVPESIRSHMDIMSRQSRWRRRKIKQENSGNN